MTNLILKTQNEEWGFWGTTRNNFSKKLTQQRWNDVFETLLQLSGAEPEQVRILLDSRTGRHFADECYNREEEDVKKITVENYFGWLDEDLFLDYENKDKLMTEKDELLFGTRVFNTIKKRIDIVLYTYKNKNRIHVDHAVCMTNEQKKYKIGLDHIIPVDDLDDEELKELGLK